VLGWIVREKISKVIEKMVNQNFAKGKEKSLRDRTHKKLVKQLKSMGLTDFKDRRKYLVTGPVMANIYLLIKVHKKIFHEEQSSVK